MNIVIDRKKIILIAALAIIIVSAGIVKYKILPKMQMVKDVYSVVYLSTGEIYIGHLKTWPKMELNDAYLLQTVKDSADATKSSIQLTPLKEALWSPKQLFLNKKNVIFYGSIEEGSKAAEAIRNAGK